MNNTIFHRRRAERFAQLLEEADRPRHSRSAEDSGGLLRVAGLTSGSPLDDELGGYVELGQRMRDVEHPADASPEDGFRSSLRAMLVATAQREGIGRTAGQHAGGTSGQSRPRAAARTARAPGAARGPAGTRPAGRTGSRARGYAVAGQDTADDGRPAHTGLRSRRTRGAIIIGLAVGTLALSGMSAASNDAKPGDVLYSVKRSTETARLALTTTDMMRGELYLDFAANRANEAAHPGDLSGLTSLLGDMDNQTVQGIRLLTTWTSERRDPSVLDFIDAWVTTQRARLARLFSGAERQRVGQSLALLTQIQNRSTKLRTALSCRAAIAAADMLGPVPGTCAASGGGTSGGSPGSRTSGSGSIGGSPSGVGSGSSGSSGSAPTAPQPGGAAATTAPPTNPQGSPTVVNPQEPQSTSTKSPKADGAASQLLGGLL